MSKAPNESKYAEKLREWGFLPLPRELMQFEPEKFPYFFLTLTSGDTYVTAVDETGQWWVTNETRHEQLQALGFENRTKK